MLALLTLAIAAACAVVTAAATALLASRSRAAWSSPCGSGAPFRMASHMHADPSHA